MTQESPSDQEELELRPPAKDHGKEQRTEKAETDVTISSHPKVSVALIRLNLRLCAQAMCTG